MQFYEVHQARGGAGGRGACLATPQAAEVAQLSTS
eukprot:CAMPEP_0119496082 /NCGR_PEP_ID=MMETSP1344-20130328/19531_1 /TAXON_ID=236787 /ORGANISM="Florenciella parvula, Strain CCMP2471" /LENGTH=34 /DNA_ID= /DNA_START= /DNA_END= /DNA_ORIENTATION=